MVVSSKPVISVVITAYNRKEFLLRAVRSVINQDLPRSLYEVIVIKNFRDNEIDTTLRGLEVISICMEGKVGEFLVRAIYVARGEIISFLDDDDLYKPDKLGKVSKTFTEDDELCYYHNASIFIDSNDNVREKLLKKQIDEQIRITGNEENIKKASSILRLSGSNNLSSISVRKKLIVNCL